MKISKLVKCNIYEIIKYCNEINHSEFESLCDILYSKKTFDINYPFFIEVEKLDEKDTKKQSRRYWGENYYVRGKLVRITSQWYDRNVTLFIEYLKQKEIEINYDIKLINDGSSVVVSKIRTSSRINSRYRGNAIGNAQNLVIRNILSNLGNETFSENNWNETKLYFSNRCAYCEKETELIIEHAIPINRDKLGEHRLGNIIPSCKDCNEKKRDKDYREYLGDNVNAIIKIEEYMESRNYIPLNDNEQMKKILNMAYEEVAIIANRYISILNELFIAE